MKRIGAFLLLILILGLHVYADDSNKVELTPINSDLWVHTTYFTYNGYPTPSNGVLAVTSEGIVLVDTPWTNEQTQALLRMTEHQFKKKIVLAIITHAHQDRIGGIATLLDNHIETISTALTAQCAEKAGYPRPLNKIDAEIKSFTVGDTPFEVYYPGPAHTMDNIVVYFPQTKVLFGGCIVKTGSAANLGNVAEGDTTQYPKTVQNLLNRYPSARVVIPGHGNWGGINLLRHTLELAE